MSSSLEQSRKEKLARNELMMRKLMRDAAEDLATDVGAGKDEAGQDEEGEKRMKARLEEEAFQVGRRTFSSRAATAIAKRKIADAFTGDAYQEEGAAGSDDESADLEEEDESDADSDDAHYSDSDSEIEEIAAEDAEEEVGAIAADKRKSKSKPMRWVPSQQPLEAVDEDGDTQLAEELSMKESMEPQQPAAVGRAHITTADGRAIPKATVVKRNTSGAQEKGRKAVTRRNRGLELAKEEVDDVFDFISDGKVTIGMEEFVAVVNRLGLNIDDGTVEAAFEHLKQTPYAGPCNRVDKAAFRAFVQNLS